MVFSMNVFKNKKTGKIKYVKNVKNVKNVFYIYFPDRGRNYEAEPRQ